MSTIAYIPKAATPHTIKPMNSIAKNNPLSSCQKLNRCITIPVDANMIPKAPITQIVIQPPLPIQFVIFVAVLLQKLFQFLSLSNIRQLFKVSNSFSLFYFS
jgi:hypothetical protein